MGIFFKLENLKFGSKEWHETLYILSPRHS